MRWWHRNGNEINGEVPSRNRRRRQLEIIRSNRDTHGERGNFAETMLSFLSRYVTFVHRFKCISCILYTITFVYKRIQMYKLYNFMHFCINLIHFYTNCVFCNLLCTKYTKIYKIKLYKTVCILLYISVYYVAYAYLVYFCIL